MNNIIPAYVSKASTNLVIVKSADLDTALWFNTIGFSLDKKTNDFEFTVYSDAEKAQILKKLQKKGICFSGGYGWSPCEVFDYLRDKKLLSRSFKEIVWQGPNEWVVHDRI